MSRGGWGRRRRRGGRRIGRMLGVSVGRGLGRCRRGRRRRRRGRGGSWLSRGFWGVVVISLCWRHADV